MVWGGDTRTQSDIGLRFYFSLQFCIEASTAIPKHEREGKNGAVRLVVDTSCALFWDSLLTSFDYKSFLFGLNEV
jgi:hypothetical protein